VAGLEAGADDYLPKPFAIAELTARVGVLLRRTRPGPAALLRFADLAVDPATREATRGPRRFVLTRTELALLEVLLHHPGQVLTHEQLYEHWWGHDPGPASNALHV